MGIEKGQHLVFNILLVFQHLTKKTNLITITSPAGWDTQGIVAAELARVARLKVTDVLILVRPIVALVAVVTLLVRGDTQPVLATELAQL